METEQTRPCGICGGLARLKFRGQPGYVAPATYDIYACGFCDASFVDPLYVDERVYDLIYTHADELQGYGRYAFYARKVAKAKDPLAYLAAQEDVYYPVAGELTALAAEGKRRVLEIGTGLGYLTYALSRAGWDATGLDISDESVRKAKERYGDRYVAADLAEFARANAGRFDAVVATEVIEHFPDPAGMLATLQEALAPGGVAILTTPNRSFYPHDVVWDTEAPPVHLWWLSEASMRFLGSRVGMEARMFDYRALNARDVAPYVPVPAGRPTRSHMIAANGEPISPESLAWRTYRGLGLPGLQRRLSAFAVEPLRKVVERFGSPQASAFGRRPTMCVIYTKRSEGEAVADAKL